MAKKIALASDHAGCIRKETIKKHLIEEGYEILDLGTNSTDPVNYVEYGMKMGQTISEGKADFGVLVCGTGVGISLSANKYKGVRAAFVDKLAYAELTRMHNDANVIALGGRFVAEYHANLLVDKFLNTKFEGGRHQERVDELNKLGQ